MSLILSLQGCMAVGKTTALKYIYENVPYVKISYEIKTNIVEQINARNLDKNQYEDYLEIQKLWINKEIKRWNSAQKYEYTLMDFGAAEIEFYSLNYPKTIGKDWEIENRLQKELTNLRKCMPDRTLFLDASEEILRRNKEQDSTLPRNSFEHHLKYLLPLKREWFIEREDVDVLNVDTLSPNEVGAKVRIWIDKCIRERHS